MSTGGAHAYEISNDNPSMPEYSCDSGVCALVSSRKSVRRSEVDRDALFVRVIDFGNRHTAVISMPGGYSSVYDTGLPEPARLCI